MGVTGHQYSSSGVRPLARARTRVDSGHFKPGYSIFSIEDHRQSSLCPRPFNNCLYPGVSRFTSPCDLKKKIIKAVYGHYKNSMEAGKGNVNNLPFRSTS